MNFQSSKNWSNLVCEKVLFTNPVTYYDCWSSETLAPLYMRSDYYFSVILWTPSSPCIIHQNIKLLLQIFHAAASFRWYRGSKYLEILYQLGKNVGVQFSFDSPPLKSLCKTHKGMLIISTLIFIDPLWQRPHVYSYVD